VSWPCRLIASPELDEHGNVDVTKRQVGDMWFLTVPPEELKNRNLTAQYFAENAGRQPVVMMLPGRTYYLVDGQCYSSDCTKCKKKRRECKCGDAYRPRGYYDGWKVTGTPPQLTVHPSINYEGRYHGYLKSGVIGDDVEGRKFDAEGKLL
jgi:hypothetical protein